MSLSNESSLSASGNRSRRVAVVGGGISGLVAAWEYRRRDPEATVELFDSAQRLGGVLKTTRIDDWLVESSADMMATQPDEGWQLCQELGLSPEMLPTNTDRRGALVYRRGRLYRVPEGFSLMASSSAAAILKSRLLSWPGKLRLAGERWVKPRMDSADESFESFALRRCGREAYEYLIRPLVSGIYTADPARLSMQATSLARFRDMELEHGSLTRAMIRNRVRQPADREATGARYSMFTAPRFGMQQLIDALTESCGAKIHQGVEVERIESAGPGQPWQVVVGQDRQTFDELIMACPAPKAAELLRPATPGLADSIGAIEHASCGVVVLGLIDPTVRPKAFGLVVPPVLGRPTLAASFSSHKFIGRSPENGLLVRVFVGGALNEAIVEEDDERLIALAKSELSELLKLEGRTTLEQVVRWRRTMPQYHVGHQLRVDQIEAQVAQWPRLALIGNAYRGVGIPDCVRGARQAVARLLAERAEANPAAGSQD